MLTFRVDNYGGVRAKITTRPSNVENDDDQTCIIDIHDASGFARVLERRMSEWRSDGNCGAWLKIPSAASRLVPAAIELGFKMHHVEENDVLVMTVWFAEDRPNQFPAYPHHQLGVGGFVLNKRNEVLCIQEKRGPTSSFPDFWKLPGGLVDDSEDLADAVVREVLEETNVRVTFRSLSAMRETHRGPFKGITDLYFVCVCVLDESVYGEDTIPEPTPQDAEIANARWIPLKEFLGSRYYRKGLYGEMLRAASQTAIAATFDSSSRGDLVFKGHGLGREKLPALGGKMESLYAFYRNEASSTRPRSRL